MILFRLQRFRELRQVQRERKALYLRVEGPIQRSLHGTSLRTQVGLTQ